MDVFEKLQKIRTMIFDVDGVFTDGTMLIAEDGHMLRFMDAKDGYAVKWAVKNAYRIVIITGGDSYGVKIRFKNLGVDDVFLEAHDKVAVYDQFVNDNDIPYESVMYMGDDLLDLPLMRRVFLPACPSDACHELMEVAEFISSLDGGKGCVREIIEKVMTSQDKWLP